MIIEGISSKNNEKSHGWYVLCGLFYGVKNDMRKNKYTQN